MPSRRRAGSGLDVVDEAIEEAFRQGVDVNVVYEPEARDAIEGFAGLCGSAERLRRFAGAVAGGPFDAGNTLLFSTTTGWPRPSPPRSLCR